MILFLDADCLVLRNPDHLLPQRDGVVLARGGGRGGLLDVGAEAQIIYQVEPGRSVGDRVFSAYITAEELPAGEWVFHSQWQLWDREAAALLAEDDLTELFAPVHAPDECYFGTLLQLKGYPLAEKIAAADPTWTRWPAGTGAHPETLAEITARERREWAAGSWFFARKLAAGVREMAE